MSAAAGFDLGAYGDGWDAAAWSARFVEGLTLDQLATEFGCRAEALERLSAGDELHHPESAAYKAGASYAYRMAQAAICDVRNTL